MATGSLRLDSSFSLFHTVEEEEGRLEILKLNRGGVIVQTSLGPIQFGIPPETMYDLLFFMSFGFACFLKQPPFVI